MSNDTLGEASGFVVCYDADEAPFPAYVAGFFAAAFLAGAFITANWVFFLLGVGAFAFAYYNFPLTEKGRPRLGANQYGIFVDGLGLVRWSAIKGIDIVEIAFRAITFHEVHIALNQPVTRALMADWRKAPAWRLLMRVPWRMSHDNVIRIRVDPFDREPAEIHRTLLRMWRYYRS